MDKKLKARWVKALRSGKYKQGQGFLKSGGEFCCLGVLRDIVHPRSKLANGSVLHDRHLQEFGLTSFLQAHLAAMNDGSPYERRRSFAEIATWIEKNL